MHEDVRLHDPKFFEEHGFPYAIFDDLRKHDPVHWHEDDIEGVPFWAVTRHEDIMTVSRDNKLFSSWEQTSIFREPNKIENELEQQRLILVNQDPPEHTRLRTLVSQGFTPRMIKALEGRIREFTDELVSRALAKGEGDFVEDISSELPLEVIAEIMGAPLEDRAKIFDLSNRLIAYDDEEYAVDPGDLTVAAMEMYAYSDELRKDREVNPKDDVVTRLAQAEVDGDKLNELEFNLFFLILAVAGNETTRNAITHGMRAMLEHPDQWKRLQDDPSLAMKAADEIIRWGHPLIQFRRTATADTELSGTKIKKGDKVVIYYPSANFDETVFDDPYTFDIGRDPNPHVSFGGGGPHFCLGAHLARLEVGIMFEQLALRLPDIKLAGEPVRLKSNFIHGIKRMPVTYK